MLLVYAPCKFADGMENKISLFLKLRNIGLASSRMLANAGIKSESQLRAMGAVAAFVAVKNSGYAASLNLLWALEGALTDRDWKEVSRDDRTALLIQLDDYERTARASN